MGYIRTDSIMTTYEICPHCGYEKEIPANERTFCSTCGHIIIPCSTCYDDLPGYKNCDWTKEEGCWRFPNYADGLEIYQAYIRIVDAKRKVTKGITTLDFARMAGLTLQKWCDIRGFRVKATREELAKIHKAEDLLGKMREDREQVDGSPG